VTLVGEEQVTAQRVEALALVQLPSDSPSESFICNESAEVDGADEPAIFLQQGGSGAPARPRWTRRSSIGPRCLLVSTLRGKHVWADHSLLSTRPGNALNPDNSHVFADYLHVFVDRIATPRTLDTSDVQLWQGIKAPRIVTVCATTFLG
jgi:hypothetical protein